MTVRLSRAAILSLALSSGLAAAIVDGSVCAGSRGGVLRAVDVDTG